MVKRKGNTNMGSQAASLVIAESPKGLAITAPGSREGRGKTRDKWRYRSRGEAGWGEDV